MGLNKQWSDHALLGLRRILVRAVFGEKYDFFEKMCWVLANAFHNQKSLLQLKKPQEVGTTFIQSEAVVCKIIYYFTPLRLDRNIYRVYLDLWMCPVHEIIVLR